MTNNGLIKSYVAGKLNRLAAQPNQGVLRAELAKLRRGIGKVPGEIPELWGMFLQELPDELQSKQGGASRTEWAIYTALTLYALHQQSADIITDNMNSEALPLGKAIRCLIPKGDEEAEKRIRTRFNVMAVSSDMKELAYHLRGLIQLLRAAQIPLDYPSLASDLYSYQFPERISDIRLKWGRDFYSYSTKTDDQNDNNKVKEG